MKCLFKNSLYFILLVIAIGSASGQGKLMLVGGGTEKDTDYSWSNTPYQWAIQQSANMRVAIIAFAESDDPGWLPDYFIKLGASHAKNFVISTADSAQSTVTYDSLMKYDVFFFKGGDQYNYYTTYKNTQVEEAITDKFNSGGVIAGTSAGMAMLSGVIYTAANGSLYPDEALQNMTDEKITLADDFLTLLPDYIVDTHFIERGRMPRLMAFMANWYLEHAEMLTGIGVDDRTAFCIDENKIGHVYGIGAVSIVSGSSFSENNGVLTTDSIHTTALLHGQTYDLNSKTIESSLTDQISSDMKENGNYTVYLSGSDLFDANQELLQAIKGQSSTAILISEDKTSNIENYISYLTDLGVEATLMTTSQFTDSCSSAKDRNLIKDSRLFFIFDSNIETYKNTGTGQLLTSHLKRGNTISVFMGRASQLAGGYFASNNTDDPLSSYYGNLTFSEGLNILEASIIIPDAYDPSSSDFYENNTSAVSYALVAKRLKYGLLINRNSFVRYSPEGGTGRFYAMGDYASLLLKNIGQSGGVADQPVDQNGNTRNIAGFDQIQWSWLHETYSATSDIQSGTNPDYTYELTPPMEVTVSVADGDNVVIRWTNTSNLATGVDIERSENGSDFIRIATVDAVASSFEDTVEDYTSEQYRLQSTDGSLKSCYSNVAGIDAVMAVLETLGSHIKVYPNPVMGERLYIIAEKPIEVELVSQLGVKVVKKQLTEVTSELDLSHVQDGIYHLLLHTPEGQETVRIFVNNGIK